MENKKLIQLLLPLYDDKGRVFPESLYTGVKNELVEKFGGLTAYTRSPATGLWKEGKEKVTRDEIIIYEIVTKTFDEVYWINYKKSLENRFKQDQIMITCSDIKIL